MKTAMAAIVGAGLVALTPALAQPPESDFISPMKLMCAEDSDLLPHLTDREGYDLVGRGIIGERHVMSVYLHADGRFTLTVSMASGEDCVAAIGHAWEDFTNRERTWKR